MGALFSTASATMADEADVQRDMTYYPRNVEDIHLASELLIRVLKGRNVPHIVNNILDYSQYWPRAAATNDRLNRVSEGSEKRPYLAVLPTESGGIVLAASPIRKIMWTVTGKDQGWASDRNGGSWTWWVACKLPHERPDLEMPETVTFTRNWEDGPVLARNEIAGRNEKVSAPSNRAFEIL